MVDSEQYFNELIGILQLTARFQGGKEALISTVCEGTGIPIKKSISYKNLLRWVQEKDLEKEFCQIIFDVSSFKEVTSRAAVWSGLSLLSADEILKVADYLSDDRHTWKYDKSSATKALTAVGEKESLEEVNKCLSTLMSTNRIELLARQNKKWVVGPLGISQAVEYRKAGHVWSLRSLIEEELPSKLLEDFLKLADWMPTAACLTSNANDQYRRQEFIQLVLTYGTNSNILSTFNKLIGDGVLDFKTVRTYGFNIVGTPCGVFERQYNGVNHLAQLVINECSEDQLKILLSQKRYFSLDVKLGAVELCIRENPVSILNEFFGWADLVRIAKNLDLVRVGNISKSRLAEVVSIRLGFELPAPIEGLTRILEQVEKSIVSINESSRSREESDGIMSGIYRSIEAVLKDMLRFYVGFLWPESLIEEEPSERREAFNRFCRVKFSIDKADGVDGLTLGELLQIFHKLNDVVKEEPKLQEKLSHQFNRKFIIPSKLLMKLEEGLQARRYLSHDKGRSSERKDAMLIDYVEALGKIREFLQKLKQDGIYPRVIRVRREVTDEWGRRYVEAIDDDEKAWLIHSDEYLWPNESYFMHTVTSAIAVAPYLSVKFS